ncbi:MAG TPA: mechanosensitive ion channel domain-containing protein [Steroidobacteraceae bacterium]|nr:mechanosensitive ion channel domain-containing protein [Steroidobacteraceae bacterium]
MPSADSALNGLLARLFSAPVLATAIAIVVAAVVALAVGRALRGSRVRARLGRPLEALVLLAPSLAALAMLLGARALLGATAIPTSVLDGVIQLLGVYIFIRLGVYALGLFLGPGSWVRSRQDRIALTLWAVAAIVELGWLDQLQSVLNHINLVPGKTQFSLWALLKGLVVVTAFVVVTSLIARAIERHVMRLEQLAVSTRVGVSKFTYFLLVGLGVLLGINAAGVDVTTLNVLTGAIGLGLGFGLQSVASNFVSGFVLLMDKSIKPGDVISFTTHGDTTASAGNFGWVQELRGRYVVVRDRDGVDTLVPNQNLITNSFINWSYSDQRVRLKLPVTVSYDDDPELALQLLVQATENHPRILRDPAPVSRLISFEDNGMRLEIRFWIADPVNGVNNVRSDVNRAIWRIFREHGVRIPVPQQETRLLERRRTVHPASGESPQSPAGVDRAAD